jgi:hypothetical protein
VNGFFTLGAVWGLTLALSPVLQAKKLYEVAPMVTVRVYNLARVPSYTLRRAKVYATEIFKNSGVEIVWADGTIPTEPDSGPTAKLELMVVIRAHATQPLIRNQDAMGTTWRDVADVFYDRVKSSASTLALAASFFPLAEPAVLGHVIAHELGHLLLLSHSKQGIMRAQWNSNDFWRPGTVELLFTPVESERLRAELTRRIRSAVH